MNILKLTLVRPLSMFDKPGRRSLMIPVSEFVEAQTVEAGDFDDTPEGATSLVFRREFDEGVYVVETLSQIFQQLNKQPEL